MWAKMGQTKSKDTKQEVTENGVVNSNFIVQEAEYNITKDVKVVLYLIFAMLAMLLLWRIIRAVKKNMKKQIRRDMAAVSLASIRET